MDKTALRTQIRARRRAGHQADPAAYEQILDMIPGGGTVCGYVSLPGEPPTTHLLERLIDAGHEVFLPVAEAHGVLRWVCAADSQPWDAWGVVGRPGCPVPAVELPTVDVILVPALAVTPDGQRLGQGGGYYDRFLAYQPHARKIALVWADEVLSDVGAQSHDIAVDDWVTLDG